MKIFGQTNTMMTREMFACNDLDDVLNPSHDNID